MNITRRKLFGLFGGAAAAGVAAVIPKAKAASDIYHPRHWRTAGAVTGRWSSSAHYEWPRQNHYRAPAKQVLGQLHASRADAERMREEFRKMYPQLVDYWRSYHA